MLKEDEIILCGHQVKITRVPDVFYSQKRSELRTGNFKITMEMFFQALLTPLSSKFSRITIFFRKSERSSVKFYD